MNKTLLYILFLLCTPFTLALSGSNLIEYYKFDGNNTNNISSFINTHYLYNSGTGASFVAGKINNGLKIPLTGGSFNGTMTALGDGDFSINFWQRINATSNTEVWVGVSDLTATGFYFVRHTASSTQTFRTTGSTTFTGHITTGFAMVTYTYDKATQNLSYFINGALDNSSIVALNIGNATTRLSVGQLDNGTIDELSIWKRKLSTTDITELYNSGNAQTIYAPNTENADVNYSIKPYSSNYFLSINGEKINADLCSNNVISNNTGIFDFGTVYHAIETCYSDDSQAHINVYPSAVDATLNPTLQFKIDSSSSTGYQATICNYSTADISHLPVYSLTFDGCTDATSCGMDAGTPQFYTQAYDIGNGRQLVLNATGNRSFTMGSLLASTLNRFETFVEYRPWINTATVFTLDNQFGQNILNVYIDRDALTTACVYTATDKNGVSRTLQYCIENYTGARPLDVGIIYNPVTAFYYVQVINEENSASYKSNAVASNTDLAPAVFTVNAVTIQPYSYIDNFVQYAYQDNLTLTAVNIPTYPSCTYEIGKCYDTRIYFSTSMNDYSNYKDYIVCGVGSESSAPSTAVVPSGATQTDPTNRHRNIALIVTAIALIGGAVIGFIIAMGSPFAGLIGMALGLILMTISLVGFSVAGWLSPLIVFLLVVFDAMILAVMLRGVFMGE